MARASTALFASIALLALPRASAARAQSRVVLLGYRAGVRFAPDLAERMAHLLTVETSLAVAAPADARRILGAQVDDQVAQCAGEAVCMAAIGRSLGVDEVILVGVSQLGDVVLSIQRIRCTDAAVEARVAESISPTTDLTDAMLDRYLRELLPPAAFLRYGRLSVRANVDGAAVLVNGTSRGVSPLPPLMLKAPGSYMVRIEKAGYQPFVANVAVAPEAEVTLAPLLAPLPAPAPAPLISHWWFWAGAGVTAAAAATATALLLARPTVPGRVPVTITWP